MSFSVSSHHLDHHHNNQHHLWINYDLCFDYQQHLIMAIITISSYSMDDGISHRLCLCLWQPPFGRITTIARRNHVWADRLVRPVPFHSRLISKTESVQYYYRTHLKNTHNSRSLRCNDDDDDGMGWTWGWFNDAQWGRICIIFVLARCGVTFS